jgi:hypothetical protein
VYRLLLIFNRSLLLFLLDVNRKKKVASDLTLGVPGTDAGGAGD